MSDNQNNAAAKELDENLTKSNENILKIIQDRPRLIEYYNSLSHEELLEGLDVEIQMLNKMLKTSASGKKQI